MQIVKFFYELGLQEQKRPIPGHVMIIQALLKNFDQILVYKMLFVVLQYGKFTMLTNKLKILRRFVLISTFSFNKIPCRSQ